MFVSMKTWITVQHLANNPPNSRRSRAYTHDSGYAVSSAGETTGLPGHLSDADVIASGLPACRAPEIIESISRARAAAPASSRSLPGRGWCGENPSSAARPSREHKSDASAQAVEQPGRRHVEGIQQAQERGQANLAHSSLDPRDLDCRPAPKSVFFRRSQPRAPSLASLGLAQRYFHRLRSRSSAARDHRRRPTQAPGDLANTRAPRPQQRDLLALLKAQVPTRQRLDHERGHSATLSKPPAASRLRGADRKRGLLAAQPFRDLMPEQPLDVAPQRRACPAISSAPCPSIRSSTQPACPSHTYVLRCCEDRLSPGSHRW